MITLALFEFASHDSSAEIVLAVWILSFMILILSFASIKVWRITRLSQQLHRSAAYLLYSNSKLLNKWGFLYVQYRATMTFFLGIILMYSFIKGSFIGLGQSNGRVQVVGLFILEIVLLAVISWLKPYMDKKTNAFNISIASVNFINIFILLLISDLVPMPVSSTPLPTIAASILTYNQPLGVGILGVIYFLLNTVFTGVVIIMTIWTAIRAMIRRNPDSDYPALPDDRHSFMQSLPSLAISELDALSKTARGESQMSNYSGTNIRSTSRTASRNESRVRRRSQDDIESVVVKRKEVSSRGYSEK